MVANSTPEETAPALIAFGSNQGDRQRHLRQALAQMAALSDVPLECSSWWRSAPVAMATDAGEFINGVARIHTRLSPRALMLTLQAIEQQQGRPVDHGFNASRVLDLDIICYGQLQLEEPDLVLPHPRATGRVFVLKPLAELAPSLVLPGQSLTVSQLLDRLDDQAVSFLQAAPALPLQPLRVQHGQ